MQKLISYEIDNSAVLGTTVKLDLVYDEAPDSVAISIYSPTEQELENDQAMTVGASTKNYTYQYQSSISYAGGKYTAWIEATFGTNVVKDIIFFNLEDFDLE